tara:strand:- start:1091 stop:1651 length:561 start_codon:yes stop_codon:yes gene_type:complete
MLSIKKTLVSEELLEKKFICDLERCKGLCCVKGISGAPLEKGELKILKENFKKIKPFLNKKGLESIKKNGLYVKGNDGEWETPLVNGKECAYAVFESNGTVKCGIENSFRDKKIKWRKPISCHLYPVRVKNFSRLTAVNYHEWGICSSACKMGNDLKVPLYKFLKKPLIRKFGLKWYEELSSYTKK